MKVQHMGGPLCLAASMSLLGPWPEAAIAQLLGTEFHVNSYTTSNQYSSVVAADGSGKFVVVWDSDGQDGSSYGVFGQRFNAAGSPVGSEFLVNTFTTNNQWRPGVATNDSGSFVVVWTSMFQDGSAHGIFAQRFDAAGSRIGGEFQVNNYSTGDQFGPEVASDSSGNFVVVWNSGSQDGSNYGVFGQRFSSAGSPLGGEFQVNTFTTDSQRSPAVAVDGLGNFVVVWHSQNQDGSNYGVFGQRFDSAGIKLGSEFQINSHAADEQGKPAVAADALGNFVVAWESWYQDGSTTGIFGQRFNSAGNEVGGEFQVNSYTMSFQLSPAVAADDSGNFVVAWSSLFQDGSSDGVFAQRFNLEGNPVRSEFQVSTYTTSYQGFPKVIADGSGNFVVAWSSLEQDGSGMGIFGQRLTNWILVDGFESNDTCGWSAAVGGGCP